MSHAVPHRKSAAHAGDGQIREQAQWRARQVRQRSYANDVLAVVEGLRTRFDVSRYGEVAYGDDRYPVHAIRPRQWGAGLPTVLVTGGVHGYETSGVLTIEVSMPSARAMPSMKLPPAWVIALNRPLRLSTIQRTNVPNHRPRFPTKLSTCMGDVPINKTATVPEIPIGQPVRMQSCVTGEC